MGGAQVITNCLHRNLSLLAVALRKGFAVGHCIAIIILTLVLLALLVWCVCGQELGQALSTLQRSLTHA